MKVAQEKPTSIRKPFKSLQRQLRKEIKLPEKKRRRPLLQHTRLSAMQWWTILVLAILMLLAMVLGAYLGDKFKGRMIVVESRPPEVRP